MQDKHNNQLALAEAIIKYQPALRREMAEKAQGDAGGVQTLSKAELVHVLDQVQSCPSTCSSPASPGEASCCVVH